MGKISVIVPVYNVEKYIFRCVDSILVQTFTDFELILVDDGSTDDSGNICDEYAKRDSRVKVIHQDNQGQGKARNAGLDFAYETDSEWLCFVDSDDWVHTQYLEALYSAVNGTGIDVSACGEKVTRGENVFDFDELPAAQKVNTEQYYCNRENTVAPWGKLFSKKCFSQLRYPEGIIHEDEFIIYKILFKLSDIAYVDAPLYAYFYNDSGTTKSKWSPRRLVVFEAYDEQIDFFEKRGFQLAYRNTVSTYVYKILDQLDACLNFPYYSKYRKKMTRMLRAHLRKYKKEKIFSVKNTPWVYEAAYPRLMKMYWIFQALENQLKRGK